MEKELANLSLDDEEDEILQARMDPDSETERVEFFLVSCFLTTSVIHFPAMRSTVANLWHPVERVQILELGEKQGEDPLKVSLVYANFWVQIHGVPIGFFNGVFARQLGDFLTKYMEYDSMNLDKGL
ncbi:hypothetical protein Gotri_020791 [Gossypium trilobum]|uniref:DUF4283 domain-containing protein n=1 Tax=Gossypium trilobum TaxID=34281 RepID=A0A7J9DAG1_9ROSI|nr:hypothetical protein [Gossypium trilobum]